MPEGKVLGAFPKHFEKDGKVYDNVMICLEDIDLQGKEGGFGTISTLIKVRKSVFDKTFKSVVDSKGCYIYLGKDSYDNVEKIVLMAKPLPEK